MSKYSCSVLQDRDSIKRMLDRDGYKAYKFKDIFDDITSKGRKIKTDDYLEFGEYPIIDQGSAFVSGYLNENTNLLKDIPLIVFGDHTRCLKYVDFPIYLGADGVKVLKNKLGEDKTYTRFLYYYLKSINIPNTGYNRHFKYLKEVLFVLPPLETQKKIVEALDNVQELIKAKKDQIHLMDQLVKSKFVEMFGFIDNKKFDIFKLEDLCEFITDGTHQTPIYTKDKINGFKFLSSKDITSGKIDWGKIKYIPADLHNQLYKRISPKRNDILLAKNGTTGVAAIVDNDEIFDIYVSLAILRLKKDNNPYYLLHAINSVDTKRQFDSSLKGIGVPNLHLGEIRKTNIILPPKELQNQYVEFVQYVCFLKSKVQETLDETLIILDSLMQEYFE